ncbi:hypothetical protein FRB91_008452 [Serendipita sp. 411]|nr:hypothetical protein FRB91_008452 [Serendipita sp. 411]
MLVLGGITVELSAQDDHFLNDISHLVLELNSKDEYVDRADLLSRMSSPGVWDANEIIVLLEVTTHFSVSIFGEFGGEERQILASKELHGPDLYDGLGEAVEILLDGHENYPNMILKTKVVAADPSSMIQALSDNVGVSSFDGSESSGNPGDIDGVNEREQLVGLAADDDPDKSSRLYDLGTSLLTRFQRLGNVDDIDNAIMQLQAATNLTPDDHPDKPTYLNDLGTSLLTRFEHLGNLGDLDESLARLQAGVTLIPDYHPHKPNLLNSLGSSLQVRFKRLGNLGDIDDSITQFEAGINLTPDGHAGRPCLLGNLGNSLRIRFKRLGNLGDLDNSIAQLQAAINLPASHPYKPGLLSNIGISFRIRFQRLGNPGDIDNSIASHQEAVHLARDGHPDKPKWLSNLGISLRIRFEHLGDLDDIDNSIAQLQASVNLTPDRHPERPGRLNNLGTSLKIRFERLGNLRDVDDSISRLQVAVDLTPDGHPDKPKWLNNIGNSLRMRFQRLGNIGDLDDSVSRLQAAVNLASEGHPDTPGWLINLGTSLLTRFQYLHCSRDAEACIAQLSVAASSTVGSPSIRLTAAKSWIHAAITTDHPSLLAACECAVTIIPLVAWLGLSIPDRHRHLVQIGTTVRLAAALAISLGEYNKAVEWLEQGRSIVWTQVLQLRTPVDKLREVEPELADRLLHVSSLLDQGSQGDKSRSDHNRSPEEEARQYRALAKERDDIVEKIRSLPKFHDFLKPLRLKDLAEAAKEGPVVVINVSERRCDALALVYGVNEAIHIPLPDLTSERVTQFQIEFNSLLKAGGLRQRAVRDEEEEIGGDEGCKRILAELWNHLVNPVLDSLAFNSDPDTLPRIWWCVTGPLAFLPIHAAGVYDTEESSRRIQDYAIASYAPTISALLDQSDAPHKSFRHLSAIEPSSGRSYIPNTEKELECIQRRLHNRDYVVLRKAGATKERVMNAMKECNWLHLACHGTQNAKDPTKTALELHGGKLTLEEIIRLNLPHAEFAFLSACQTMTGDEGLSDEAVHIAGAMSLAGYRSVVATMWSIKDELAPKVADEFYARLLKDGERPDSRKAAEALHFSVKKLREEEKDIKMLSWLPFVHLGI